ncbi:MAG: hypothetical protein HOQ02_12070 [Lysobacter sp.]|nr:hypothetical protein [Lysobacter sp.]
MIRFAFCLLLLCLAAGAQARDIRMHGPNGDGGGSCADDSSAPLANLLPATRATPAAPLHRDGRPKAPTTLRSGGSSGGDDTGMHAPRWHSFLPGMFR